MRRGARGRRGLSSNPVAVLAVLAVGGVIGWAVVEDAGSKATLPGMKKGKPKDKPKDKPEE